MKSQKLAPLPRPSTNLRGGENPYVRFGYSPLTICNHTQGKFSVSMNTDPINMIHISKQSTKEGLNEELEGHFQSIKEIN